MRLYTSPRTPPPCAEKCWEWINLHGWLYTASITECGHFFDTESGVWKWSTDPRSERGAA